MPEWRSGARQSWRSTTRCFGDGGGEEDRTSVGTIGPSVPLIRILRETRTLHAHDAEALSGRGLHHHPALLAVHVRAQLLKVRNFGRDIVGLDIQVHAAFVIDALNLHNGFVRWGLQYSMIAATAQWLRSTGRPSAFAQKRAASSTSEYAVPEGQGIRRQGRIAGFHRLHRHRSLRLDHLHLRQTRRDHLCQVGVTGPAESPRQSLLIWYYCHLMNLTRGVSGL